MREAGGVMREMEMEGCWLGERLRWKGRGQKRGVHGGGGGGIWCR